MGTNDIDEMKGRAKQAAGDLTDDDDLKDEGKIEQVAADVKDKVDGVADRVKDAVSSD